MPSNRHLWLLVLTIVAFADRSRSARIVGIFTHIGGSHFDTFYPIMNALAERGHNVTVLSYFRAKQPHPNYHERRFDGLPLINSSVDLANENPSRSYWQLVDEFQQLYALGDRTCRHTFASGLFDELLAEHSVRPFDLAITELFDSDCVLGIIHRMRVPYVGLSSCALMPWLYDRIALPDLPSYVPNEFVGSSERMTYAERAQSWLAMKTLKLLYRHLIEANDNRLLADKFGAGVVPDVAELARNVSLVLINTHFSLHGVRPAGAQLIEIGGVHIKDAKPLPARLLAILDAADEHGAIVISWGSNIKAASLDAQRLRAILRALEQLPQQFVWKWEDARLLESGTLPANVHVEAWLPQRDLLAHRNVRAFWTHGGNLGISEAAHCGVPVIVTAIYGDQFFNEAAARNRRVAVSLPFDRLGDERAICEALTDVLRPEYAEAAGRLARAFVDRPMAPVETAVWWVEHVLRSGGFPLGRSYATEMSWHAYHSVDVWLPLFAAVTFVVWLLAVGLMRLGAAVLRLGNAGPQAKKLKRK